MPILVEYDMQVEEGVVRQVNALLLYRIAQCHTMESVQQFQDRFSNGMATGNVASCSTRTAFLTFLAQVWVCRLVGACMLSCD